MDGDNFRKQFKELNGFHETKGALGKQEKRSYTEERSE